MFLLARFVSFAILIVASVSFQVTRAGAQGWESSESGIGPRALPSAPEPQVAAPSKESSYGWPAGALAGTGKQNENAGREQEHAHVLEPAGASLSGTVTDANGDVVPGATIKLEGGPETPDRRTATASETGAFHFEGLKPGIPYHITIEARDLDIWKSEPIIFEAGQYFYLKDIRLKVPARTTSVTVYATQEQIAIQ